MPSVTPSESSHRSVPTHAELVARLPLRLQEPLPGIRAQIEMAPYPARKDPATLSIEGKKGREAATLVLLFPQHKQQESALVLTVRQPELRDHSGQVSLPGGRIERGETPEEAAIREGHEEVGIALEAPQILGRLSPLFIPPSGFSVYPIVAAMDERPPFKAQETEVAALVEVPIAHLLDNNLRRSSPRRLYGREYDVPHIALGGYEVWGATAMMLAELTAVLSSLPVR